MIPPGRTLLVEYCMSNGAVLVFGVRHDWTAPEVVEVRLQPAVLRRYAERHFTGEQHNRLRDWDLLEWQEQLGALVEPLARWADEGDTVWLVPHGALHRLPLHTLRVAGQDLVDRHPVCYTPSAAVMKHCRSRKQSKRENVLVVGDSRNDLPHAAEEARTVADLFRTAPLLGSQASRSGVLSRLQASPSLPDLVHFACHVRFDPGHPLHSGIVLAEEAGVPIHSASLTAEDILRLRLRADLVTLSGCASGVSEHNLGDELLGLPRALLYAGTPSLVVSLWPVDDLSTSVLMRQFYQELLKAPEENGGRRVTKGEALQRAQKYLKAMTAGQVIEFCTMRLQGLAHEAGAERIWQLQADLLRAHLYAGDLLAASAISRSAGPRLEAFLDPLSRTLKPMKILEAQGSANAASRPFAHPFFWAPFILVGDWR
jgi:CHAT domain-containing protein